MRILFLDSFFEAFFGLFRTHPTGRRYQAVGLALLVAAVVAWAALAFVRPPWRMETFLGGLFLFGGAMFCGLMAAGEHPHSDGRKQDG